MKSILIVDDDKLTRETLAKALAPTYQVSMAANGEEALAAIAGNDIDLALLDLLMPDMNGLVLQEKIKSQGHDRPMVIFITGHGTVESAVQAMQLGAYDYITKPVHLDRLFLLIEKAMETRKLREENTLLRNKIKENYTPTKMVGQSAGIKKILGQLEQVAPTTATVFIEGESGTGKELIANIIHYNSARATGPFIKVNCGAFVENLLESELFGHEKGAFTGAIAGKKGRFELADTGTLFLDEVGDLPLTAQIKLLRFLQEKTFERVGGTKTIKVDVRIISATNRNLEEMVAKGEFREDLFYRLCVVRVKVPPLRARQDDIEQLAHHFLQMYTKTHNRPLTGISEELLALMRGHAWPGNVRELMNCVECLVVSATTPQITLDDVPEYLLANCRKHGVDIEADGILARSERQLITETMQQTGGDKPAAAKILGIGLRTLYRRLEQWNI